MNQRAFALTLFLGIAFFLVTATTFASLGVLLPVMIAEFKWSWTTAGLGFTVLSLLTGVFSPIAASSLAQLGPVRHYALAGAVMAAGYWLLGAAAGVISYLVATALMGAGFALLANVPGTYLVGRAAPEQHRSIHIGAYLAAGGAGGVLGPIIANALIASGADWRLYWRLSALAILVAAVVIALLARRVETGGAPKEQEAASEETHWTPRKAIRTPTFGIIALALTVVYFCGVTVSTWSVAHLQQRGLDAGFSVLMLSLYSGVNAAARAAGGVAVKRISAKTLLTFALLGNVVGMIALAYAASEPAAIVFALFDGFAFGMALFATTALLIDAFGLRNSPALLGAVNLGATVAMLGPTIAGQTADRWGGFAPIFLIYAGAALVAAIAVAAMPTPQRTSQ
jgi:MFS family permease